MVPLYLRYFSFLRDKYPNTKPKEQRTIVILMLRSCHRCTTFCRA